MSPASLPRRPARRSSHQLSHLPSGRPFPLPGALGRCWRDSTGQQQGPAGCSPGRGGAEAQHQLPGSSARPGPWGPCSLAFQQISTAGPHGSLVPSPRQAREPSRAESCPGAPGPWGGAGSPPRVPAAPPCREQHPPRGQCSGNRPEKQRTGDRRRYKSAWPTSCKPAPGLSRGLPRETRAQARAILRGAAPSEELRPRPPSSEPSAREQSSHPSARGRGLP